MRVHMPWGWMDGEGLRLRLLDPRRGRLQAPAFTDNLHHTDFLGWRQDLSRAHHQGLGLISDFHLSAGRARGQRCGEAVELAGVRRGWRRGGG